MASNPGSAALAGNPGDGGDAGASNADATAAAQTGGSGGETVTKAWYEEAGIDPKFHETIKAKDWKSPNDVFDGYTNIEKLVSMERGGEVDRILVRPKADATPEEQAAFRSKAGFAAPENAEGYGFTAEMIGSRASQLFAEAGLPADNAQLFVAETAPVVEQAAKWFQEAGVPADLAKGVVDKFLGDQVGALKQFTEKSNVEYTQLQQQMGDKFGDFEEAGRRAFRASGLEKGTLDKIEMAIGSKSMMEMFGKFGAAMAEAGAPQPGRAGTGQFSTSPEAAKSQIEKYSRDSDFQARLNSPNPEVRKEALKIWEGLFLTAGGEKAA